MTPVEVALSKALTYASQIDDHGMYCVKRNPLAEHILELAAAAGGATGTAWRPQLDSLGLPLPTFQLYLHMLACDSLVARCDYLQVTAPTSISQSRRLAVREAQRVTEATVALAPTAMHAYLRLIQAKDQESYLNFNPTSAVQRARCLQLLLEMEDLCRRALQLAKASGNKPQAALCCWAFANTRLMLGLQQAAGQPENKWREAVAEAEALVAEAQGHEEFASKYKLSRPRSVLDGLDGYFKGHVLRYLDGAPGAPDLATLLQRFQDWVPPPDDTVPAAAAAEMETLCVQCQQHFTSLEVCGGHADAGPSVPRSARSRRGAATSGSGKRGGRKGKGAPG